MRTARDAVPGQFDAAMACDDALPHLPADYDLLVALLSIRACLRPGGLFLASNRDYDLLAATRPAGVLISMYGQPGARHASGEAWAWSAAADSVDITLFTMVESGAGWRVRMHETTYRARRQRSLTSALRRSGCDEPRWLAPDESDCYQPIVLVRDSGG